MPRIRLVALAAAAALAGGCGRPVALPVDSELPLGPNQECGCLRDKQCATIEAEPGWSQLRNVSCRWIEPSEAARCRYEERRVDWERPEGYERPERGGELIELSPWRRGEVTARRYERGWCAA